MTCRYRCLKCTFEFTREHPGPTKCERCGHKYLDWVNYKEVMAALKREEEKHARKS